MVVLSLICMSLFSTPETYCLDCEFEDRSQLILQSCFLLLPIATLCVTKCMQIHHVKQVLRNGDHTLKKNLSNFLGTCKSNTTWSGNVIGGSGFSHVSGLKW